MKILKQTMSDIEYLKKNCRNEKIKDALEKTIKLSGNKISSKPIISINNNLHSHKIYILQAH